MRVTAAATSSTNLPSSMVVQLRPAARPLPLNDPYTVYDESGDYAGRDPDPNIRFELHRDNARDE